MPRAARCCAAIVAREPPSVDRAKKRPCGRALVQHLDPARTALPNQNSSGLAAVLNSIQFSNTIKVRHQGTGAIRTRSNRSDWHITSAKPKKSARLWPGALCFTAYPVPWRGSFSSHSRVRLAASTPPAAA